MEENVIPADSAAAARRQALASMLKNNESVIVTPEGRPMAPAEATQTHETAIAVPEAKLAR